MPVHKRYEEVIGYVSSEKVWCKWCWNDEKPKVKADEIRMKNLRKNFYKCDVCKGELPVSSNTIYKLYTNKKLMDEYIKRSMPQINPG